MKKPKLETRSELPWLVAALVLLLGGWQLFNRLVLGVYPHDPSEHGAFHVITYGSDPNPARADQINKFNQFYRKDDLKVALVPGGSDASTLLTTSAARTAPDIIDVYQPEDLRTYMRKGIALPLNAYLKAARLDPALITWPSRLDELRLTNPAWKPGDPSIDRYLWYAVPNNLDAPVVFLNHSLYERARAESALHGQPFPAEPWLDWTWWDYAVLARALQRRGDGGRLLSFGATKPTIETLAYEIGLSQRGESREAFDRLGADERRALGIAGLGWDDCVSPYHREADGRISPFPNRAALRQALQFCYDLVAVLRGAPSSSEADQMASMGGFAAEAGLGQFKAGLLGMHITGRWFLGQVRADCAFDWRLVRMPRWVPLDEWRRWQRLGLAPGQRDGPWGEREHPRRGFGLPLGGRMAFISSSSRDPARAFHFLEYLLTNQDFNRILLIDDGMGADMRAALSYLATPDPLFPAEALSRRPEHELGTLANLHAVPPWPYTNRLLGRDQAYADMDSLFSEPGILDRALADSAERIDYAAMSPLLAGIPPSTPAVGDALADLLVGKLSGGLALGASLDSRPSIAAPSLTTVAVLGGFLVGLALFFWRWRRGRLEGIHA